MLETLLGNKVKEKILLSLRVRKEVYARDIASLFKTNLSSVQNQLKILEKGGVLISRLRGRTRIFSFNPRYPFLRELEQLLGKTMDFVPELEKKKYYSPRLRPRRTGKPL